MTDQTPRPLKIDVLMLATPNIDYYANETKRNWRAYCERHGYNFIVCDKQLVPDMHINWSMIEMMRRRFGESDADWLVKVDADSIIIRPEFRFEDILERYPAKDIYFPADISTYLGLALPLNLRGALKYGTLFLPNAGFCIIRNNKPGEEFFTRWLELARGELSHLADRHPRNQNVLWEGLFRQYRDHIQLLKKEILRVGAAPLLEKFLISTDDAFVLHDKQLTLKSADLGQNR
ncbi:hypothetical protein [Emcibacter sp.]|uniref:hypothetical protein n=1 Tax=Emcibacter sp. TaxID=1979954 RepID=UPI002AA6E1C0|nr:hypothetical protein [Emcibacter sp.]